MSSLTDAMETSWLKLLLQNDDTTAPINAIGSGLLAAVTPGSFYVSLHTTPGPGETGDQTTNEATFGAYARQAVVRSGSGWAVASGVGDNVAAITFPAATSGSETITHVGFGTAVSGTGNLIAQGALDTSRAVTTGVQIQFAIGTLDITAA